MSREHRGTNRAANVSHVFVQSGVAAPRRASSLALLATAAVAAALWGGAAIALFPWAGGYNAGDLAHYHETARRLLGGAVPYRDFAFEYPPLALVPITIPGALLGAGVDSAPHYHFALLALNAACAALMGACVLRLARHVAPGMHPSTVGAWYAALVFIGVPLFPWRFDLFVALLTAAGLLLAIERRPAWAGVALGAAIATKVYPAVMVPVIVAWYVAAGDRRGAIRCATAAAATALLAMAPFYAAAPRQFFSFVTYQGTRGFQVESLVAGLVLLRHAIEGTAVELVENFGAVHLAAMPAAGVQVALVVAMCAGVALTAWLAFARFRAECAGGVGSGPRARTLVTASFAAVVAFMVLNKVLSPQYLAWLLPFAPLAAPAAFALTAVATVLTITVFPCLYVGLVHVEPLPVLVLNARNVTLLALAAYLLWSLRPALARAPAAAGRVG
ncbi:MAG TPA: glycosyltransferase 87 family protein [Gemmatimonadaceae bacterium]|nr:glycosyltransferase 87 family protein [Gemmatimonadaceae bacterium]